MFDFDLLVTLASRFTLRCAQGLLRFFCQTVDVHRNFSNDSSRNPESNLRNVSGASPLPYLRDSSTSLFLSRLKAFNPLSSLAPPLSGVSSRSGRGLAPARLKPPPPDGSHSPELQARARGPTIRHNESR